MRAVALPAGGASPRPADQPEPAPGPGQVLVRVGSSSVNGFDVGVVDGWLTAFFDVRWPIVLGKDFAGTVAALGEGVAGFSVGDAVFGVAMPASLGADGAFAEYLAVDAGYGLAPLPHGVAPAEAGALGLAGAAALCALDALALPPGATLLVAGATGGVGSIAVQEAAAAGIRVLATARRGAEADLVRELGAEEVLDRDGPLAGQARAAAPDGVDGVLHLAGDPMELAELLTPHGCLASTLVFDGDRHPQVAPVAGNPSR